MEKLENDTLETLVRSMRRKNGCENYLVLRSVASLLNLRLDDEEVEFDDDDPYCFPILLYQICSSKIYLNCLYILCENHALHIIDLNSRCHSTRMLDEQVGTCRLILWAFQLKVSHFINQHFNIHHYHPKFMKRETAPIKDLLTYLKSMPESSETIDERIRELITEILSGMKKENPLKLEEKESVIELELSNDTFLCLLDENHQLKRLFRENKESKK